jgi:hypothetical protein
MIGIFRVIKNAEGVLAGHILSQEPIDVIMEKVESKDLRSISLDDGINLCHGDKLQRSKANLGVHFCTRSAPTLSYKKEQKSKWLFRPLCKTLTYFLEFVLIANRE